MTPDAESDWGSRLCAWYRVHQRALPWRATRDPYRIWVSEIMLQQTQVDTALPYYQRFVTRFPQVAALATAPLEDVLKLWEGLGYYARARNLHRAAQTVHHEMGGILPTTVGTWRRLCGVGEYTAAAIASIAFGVPVPAVDGNVARVATRLWALAGNANSSRHRRHLSQRLQKPVAAVADPGEFNQGLMELGARICVPQQPVCDVCPLNHVCAALAQDQVQVLPERRPGRRPPHYNCAAALVRKGRRFLVVKRKTDGMLGGLWGFPSERRNDDETAAGTARRAAAAQGGVAIAEEHELFRIRHVYTHFRITVRVFACTPAPGAPANPPLLPIKWVTAAELRLLPLSKVDIKILAGLMAAGAKA